MLYCSEKAVVGVAGGYHFDLFYRHFIRRKGNSRISLYSISQITNRIKDSIIILICSKLKMSEQSPSPTTSGERSGVVGGVQHPQPNRE